VSDGTCRKLGNFQVITLDVMFKCNANIDSTVSFKSHNSKSSEKNFIIMF